MLTKKLVYLQPCFNQICDMASNEDSWRLGEFVFPPRTSKLLKSSGSKSYNSLIASRYICIREATERQNGILLRVEGKVKAKHMMLVCGQPFCKDDSVQLFEGWSYFSYSFPTVAELAEVLNIIRSNLSLLSQFKAASMDFNPQSLFWVKETANYLITKKLKYYDASTESLCTASNDVAPYHLTMVYFNTQYQIVEPVVAESVDIESVMSVEQKTPDAKWKKIGLSLIIILAAIFGGGYLIDKYANSPKEVIPENVEKEPVAEAKTPEQEIMLSDEDSLSQEQETVSKPERDNEPISSDQYEAMDNRVRTGAYRIIGTDHIEIVKSSDDLTRICRRTIGPGMECYLEVYNGITSDSILKPGQEIKIPKLELKKKKTK